MSGTALTFAPIGVTQGMFAFATTGILFPPFPIVASVDNRNNGMRLLFDIRTLEFGRYGYRGGVLYARKRSGRDFVHGPKMLYRGKSVTPLPIEWHTLIASVLSNTHHVCGWPLTPSERAHVATVIAEQRAGLARRLIPQHVWTTLWNDASSTDTKCLFHCPTEHNCKSLAITDVLVDGDGCYLTGALVRRERIPDPRQPYRGGAALIDTVSFTALTPQGGAQHPLAIAHFTRDGTLVRAQVNYFVSGPTQVDADYFEDIALQTFQADDDTRYYRRIDAGTVLTVRLPLLSVVPNVDDVVEEEEEEEAEDVDDDDVTDDDDESEETSCSFSSSEPPQKLRINNSNE
jgi:hypothetical protein